MENVDWFILCLVKIYRWRAGWHIFFRVPHSKKAYTIELNKPKIMWIEGRKRVWTAYNVLDSTENIGNLPLIWKRNRSAPIWGEREDYTAYLGLKKKKKKKKRAWSIKRTWIQYVKCRHRTNFFLPSPYVMDFFVRNYRTRSSSPSGFRMQIRIE